jgi:Domain of unknown function (DUF397)
MDWRKSSYSSGNGGECVEVGKAGNAVAIRDTKDRDSGTLAFSSAAWSRFLGSVR